MKRLPDNIADFPKLIEGNYVYVDKTKHLYGLLTGSGENFFLSRPRRFGKTLLVSVLEQVFQGNRGLFNGLWIDKSDYTWPKHPVVRLSMAGMDSSTPDALKHSLLFTLKNKARDSGILIDELNSPALYFKVLIQELSKTAPVVILIDEYDHPILNHLTRPEVACEIREILRNFYGVIKDLDANLRFVFLTGVTKFAKTSIFSGINNLRDLSLDKSASTLLGLESVELDKYFSEQIQTMAEELGRTKSQILDALREWYNGYRFSEDSLDGVYNPCSVLKCLISHRFKNYWFETGTPSFLIQLLQTMNFQMLDLESQILSESNLGSIDVDHMNLQTLLFQTGYLTIRNYDPASMTYTVSYPNREVSQSIIEMVVPFMTQRSSFAPWQILAVKLREALENQDLETFCKLLKLFLADIPYTLHIGLEKYYQTIFYMLVKFMGAEIWIEEATNIGRIDAVLQTPTYVYVIELKLGKSAQEALKQIHTLGYAEKYKLLNKQMVAVGLAFDSEARNIVDTAWEPFT